MTSWDAAEFALPAMAGIHHLTLSVSDLDSSVAWYCEVLGFREVRRASAGSFDKVTLTRDGIVLTLVFHGRQAVTGAFDERRNGLDHLSFAVPDRQALGEWVDRLDDAGVVHGPVTRGAVGELVAFRDPDNIALEFYTRT